MFAFYLSLCICILYLCSPHHLFDQVQDESDDDDMLDERFGGMQMFLREMVMIRETTTTN